MNILTKDQVSNMKLLTDFYIKSIHKDLENAEMDGETLIKVLEMTCNVTILNAMALTYIKEDMKTNE
jgi:hypothetical protein|tara:strand:- start:39 stop:239 length:201 start_codon:yes stop_codon:yes gene_type:complete